jgi:hypothetical protein
LKLLIVLKLKCHKLLSWFVHQVKLQTATNEEKWNIFDKSHILQIISFQLENCCLLLLTKFSFEIPGMLCYDLHLKWQLLVEHLIEQIVCTQVLGWWFMWAMADRLPSHWEGNRP